MRLALAACALFAVAGAAPAGGADDFDRGALDERILPSLEQATGFVVDRTVTNFGAEFLRFFTQAWRDQLIARTLDVAIVERPSARWGSIVYVEHKQRQIARVFLYAGRSAAIRPLAASTAAYVATTLNEEAIANLFLRDPDLGREELQ